ncbi:hypothetical protein ALC57_05454 [Trachymyrmex cornetzi]|uniref:Mos1 transposase HTH domain-containing protein n=1 Tax=Trachymyrmex cornetzi TaxID=471704 RepID=A0A195EBL2_9HYME|nr:hypothetical protein ALC57_05454 [Trachymyrmex cornetzi]
MLTVAYGESTLSKKNVYKWYKLFQKGREMTYVNLTPDFKKNNFFYMHWIELGLYPIVTLFFSFVPQGVERKKN